MPFLWNGAFPSQRQKHCRCQSGYFGRLCSQSRPRRLRVKPQRYQAVCFKRSSYDGCYPLAAPQDSVELSFSPRNPAHHRAGEPVAVHLDVKNVPSLLLRVFDINVWAYYTTRLRQVRN